jgi:transcriptional regulator with XRE-family HTH domain
MDLLEISQNIKRLRQSQNMTVEGLAQNSGFSKGFISRLENFRITPSLKALQKISAALGVNITELFQKDAVKPLYTPGTLNEGRELIRDNNFEYGIHYHALAYQQIDRKLNPVLVEYRRKKLERDFLMHESDEFFVLLEGEIDFYISDDNTCRRMKANDTIYLTANLPHKVRLAPGCDYAKALIIYENNSSL